MILGFTFSLPPPTLYSLSTGVGVVSPALQAPFPAAAAVPGVLQAHQQGRNHQEGGRGSPLFTHHGYFICLIPLLTHTKILLYDTNRLTILRMQTF